MEEVEVHRATDSVCASASGEWNERWGGVPQDGHLGSDVLSLEGRLDAVRGQEASLARGRERAPAQGAHRSNTRQGDASGGSSPSKL